VFIFLRDKDLRHRLNFILAGPKRRVRRAHLGLRLRRAKRRRDELERELGEKAWLARLEPSRFETDYREIERLDQILARRQVELTDLRGRSLSVQSRLQEIRVRRKARTGGTGAATPPPLKNEEADLKKKLKALKRRIRAGEDETRRTAAERTSRLQALGEKVDERRIESGDLAGLYAGIDKINRTIVATLDQIDALK